MSVLPDILAYLPGGPLLMRMGLVALFVVVVALLAERMGPFLGAMVASLPLYTGPIYLMLALEHDTHYLAASMLSSIAICGANPVFVLAYCVAARRHGVLMSLASALAAWGAVAVVVRALEWGIVEALLFVAPIYAVAVPLAQGFTRGIAVRRAPRGRADLPIRAALCGGLSGAVIAASAWLPPQVTGILSVLPVLMSSLVLVLHPRVGGPATAALLAHTLGGLVGMVLAFALVHLTIVAYGPAVSLSAGLAVTLLWNLGLIVLRGAFSRSAAAKPPVPPPMPREPSPLPR